MSATPQVATASPCRHTGCRRPLVVLGAYPSIGRIAKRAAPRAGGNWYYALPSCWASARGDGLGAQHKRRRRQQPQRTHLLPGAKRKAATRVHEGTFVSFAKSPLVASPVAACVPTGRCCRPSEACSAGQPGICDDMLNVDNVVYLTATACPLQTSRTNQHEATRQAAVADCILSRTVEH